MPNAMPRAPDGDARAVAQEGGEDADNGEEDPDEARKPTGEKPHSNLAFFSDILTFPLTAAPLVSRPTLVARLPEAGAKHMCMGP